MLFVGDDWAEDHHDVEIQDDQGRRLSSRRLSEGVAGVAALHAIIAEHLGDSDTAADVVVGIETDRGPWVQALLGAGYQVFAINPLSASRYRDRHVTSRAKSDAGDAKVLADLVRTDRHNHRTVAGDSDLSEAIKVLARTHQNLIWLRQQQTNVLRSTLREYYPAALLAFDDLAHRDALAVLAKAPHPATGRLLRPSQIEAALRAAGRQRNICSRAGQISGDLRTQHLNAPPLVSIAFGDVTRSLVAIIQELVRQIAAVEDALSSAFDQHPDAGVLRSLPGLGPVLAARVLAEFGDDPHRYIDAKARKNYAGTSPITRASGKSRVVLARIARNRRLGDALYQWAFSALTSSPGARAHYDAQRARGATHHQALRSLANRLTGILHGCLRHHTNFDEATAWPDQGQADAAA